MKCIKKNVKQPKVYIFVQKGRTNSFKVSLHFSLLILDWLLLLFDKRRWYTSIHEVHDACKQQLIDFKKDVENLGKQRERLKRQKKKTVSGNEDEPGVEETKEEEIKTSKTEENSVSEKVGITRKSGDLALVDCKIEVSLPINL